MVVARPGIRLRRVSPAFARWLPLLHNLASLSRLLPLVVALALGLPAPHANAQDADNVTLNFVNADIEAVVKAVAEITGRNFLIDPRVKGTINIVSSRPVPRALVLPTLLSALRLQGYTVVE